MKKNSGNNGPGYKEKSIMRSGTGLGRFSGFFRDEDVEKIIREAKLNNICVSHGYLLELLNNVTKFSDITSFSSMTPGKPDKRALLSKLFRNAEGLEENIEILINQYGPETVCHIPVMSRNGDGIYQDVDGYHFFRKLQADLANLTSVCHLAKKNIEASSGKKTGDNSGESIPQLIFHLVEVYRLVTGKNAREEFHQNPAGERPYKGQFYDFVWSVFCVLNENFQVRFPEVTEPNPFRIDFTNSEEEESYSLGKYIEKVFRPFPVSCE